MWDFLTFRKMLFPVLIQLAFWLGAVACVAAGVAVIRGTMTPPEQVKVFGDPTAGALVIMIGGPFVLRLYCELMIVFFRMNDTLTDIRNGLKK